MEKNTEIFIKIKKKNIYLFFTEILISSGKSEKPRLLEKSFKNSEKQ